MEDENKNEEEQVVEEEHVIFIDRLTDFHIQEDQKEEKEEKK